MLKPHHFSYKCPLKISDLEKTEGGHFCAKCSKDIHDLTDCSIEEVIELQRRKGSLCGFVRAVSVTSLVGLAACSEEENAANNKGNVSPEPEVPENIQQELMGDICIPEKEVPKPAPEPDKPAEGDGSQVDAGDPAAKQKPEIIEIDRPVLLGVVCPPEDLKPGTPEDPKPLDPHRDGSPG